MILKKLYTHPVQLFEPVEFHNGLNIVLAHNPDRKTPDAANSKTSLHALGKSSFLDLILFALLSDFSEKSSHRLFNAHKKKLLKGISVSLDFSVNDIDYTISRSFDNPNHKIFYGPVSLPRPHYSIGILRNLLYDLIFARKDYPGFSNSYWYHKLTSFFIKVKKREDLFLDPIEFSRNLNDLEISPFHLFLLYIDNSIPSLHGKLLESILKSESFLKENQNFLKESSHTKDLTALENKRISLKRNVAKLERRIADFSLTENYSEFGKSADELTATIKNLWFNNVVDNKKLFELEAYEKNLPSEAYEDLDKITAIYNEVNSLLSGNIKKTLAEVVTFRKTIHSSRKEFVTEEKGRLTTSIFARTEQINSLESQRKKIFNQLSSDKALDDLTNTYFQLANLQKELSDIDGSLKAINKLIDDIAEKRKEHDVVLNKISDYLESLEPAVLLFRELLTSIYDKLFLDPHQVKIFEISETLERQKIKISVLEGSIIDSTGINQVRTLIYDTAVLLNIINKNLNAPHFIAHDGIFENLHKTHFFAFVSFIDEQIANNTKFQYILTLNDHDYFDEIKDFRLNKIIANTIIQLTPSKPLLGRDF